MTSLDEEGTRDALTEGGLGKSVKAVGALIAWIGGSVGSIGLILTACGFLVEHAYLESLGVPRSVFEAKPSEYMITGGNFFLGLFPLAAAGLAGFLIYFWWLALALGLAVWLTRRWSSERRFFLFTIFEAVLFFLLLYGLGGGSLGPLLPRKPSVLVAILVFSLLLATVYFYSELLLASRSSPRTPRSFLQRILARAPFVLLLLASLLLLPYLRGRHATVRPHPDFEALGAGKQFLDEIAGPAAASCGAAPECRRWQLIEMGEHNTILRRVGDGSIFVIPSDRITAFRIRQENPK